MAPESREDYLRRINSTHGNYREHQSLDELAALMRTDRGHVHEFEEHGDHDRCRRCGFLTLHDDEYMGVGGSGNWWACRRCGRERDEYEGRTTF